MSYYVVWEGREPGIYTSWDTCRQMVEGFPGAVYKSFKTKEEAAEAWVEAQAPLPSPQGGRLHRSHLGVSEVSPLGGTEGGPSGSVGLACSPPDWRNDTVLPLPLEVKAEAIAVDAACSGNPGRMEYRGVDLRTGYEVFHFGPVFGTNNIGEFLAIVHALAQQKKEGRTDTIYSDSRNAMLWVRQKKCKTTLVENARTADLFAMIRRAERWLRDNRWENPLLKWETKRWGEIPADFGRK